MKRIVVIAGLDIMGPCPDSASGKASAGCTILRFPDLHSHLSAPRAWPTWLTKGPMEITIRPRRGKCRCSVCTAK